MKAALDLAALLSAEDGWRAVTLPGSSPEVALHRLHLDAATRATVSLVRFPPGWRRPATGRYDVGEEFVLLAGDLTVSGVSYGAGDWAWLPPNHVRAASGSKTGALAVAFFTGVPRWWAGQPGDEAPSGLTAQSSAPGLLRPDEGHGWTEVAGTAPPRAGEVALDVLWPTIMHWAFAAPGEELPAHPGHAVVRHWPA